MKYIFIWWPAIVILFLRNLMAIPVVGSYGTYHDWIFGSYCDWSQGMTCGAGIIVSGAFILAFISCIVMAIYDISRWRM